MTPPSDVIQAAQAAQKKYNIPASITIAQWALESGWGNHLPAGSNNPFGIKATEGQPSVTVPTREYINGKPIIVNAAFRKFATLAEAFDAHANLLATSPAYARARMFENNPEEFADALTGVYATDPNYGKLLNAIMQGSNLGQYDQLPSADQDLAAAATFADADAAVLMADKAASDSEAVQNLTQLLSQNGRLKDIQIRAARKLLDFDGEKFPSDGCAITLSVMLQDAGMNIPDVFQAIALAAMLMKRGWVKVPIGQQQTGDIGSTCGNVPDHGNDHIYFVLEAISSDESIVADNQQPQPHFRFASGKEGKTPTKYFLRAP